MAGGLGSRYNGLKQIDGFTVYNETLLEFSIYDAYQAGFTKVVLIINELFPKSYLERLQNIAFKMNFELHFVAQKMASFVDAEFSELILSRKKPWGTAHAVLCAHDLIQEPFVVVNADDLYGRESFFKAIKVIKEGKINPENYAMVAYNVMNTLSENGGVSRGICELEKDKLYRVIEKQNIQQNQGKIGYFTETDFTEINPSTLVSMNFWVFDPSIFRFLKEEFSKFLATTPINQQEFFLPTQIQKMIIEKNQLVTVLETSQQWYGVTYQSDKLTVANYLNESIVKKYYPEDLWKL